MTDRLDRPHVPVMLAEVLAALSPAPGETYVDGTFGAGGYTRAILEAASCNVIALDRDPSAIAAGATLAANYGDRLRLVNAPFSALDEHAPQRLHGLVLDLGVSSMQLDQADRGFSFQTNGPLDMRMSQTGPHAGPTAADFINSADEADIADTIYAYGDEKRSRAIARAIVKRRDERPFERTLELADLVGRILKTRSIAGKHPATRTFQALRMHVNGELDELNAVLEAAERILVPGGRLVLVTFHSLEDRIVKQFFRRQSGGDARASRHSPVLGEDGPPPTFKIIEKALAASDAEIARNPRARSAHLRAAVRTTAPAPTV